MIYNKREANLIINIISKKTGVKLIEEGDAWRASSEEKIIYYPKGIEISDETISYLIHEASHIRFTKIDDDFNSNLKNISQKYNKNSDDIFNLINVCEDLRVEEAISKIYPGVRPLLINGTKMCFERTMKTIEDSIWGSYLDDVNSVDLDNAPSNFCFSFFANDYLGEEETQRFLDYCDIETVSVFHKLKNHSVKIKKQKSLSDLCKYVFHYILPDYLSLCEDLPPVEPSPKIKEEGRGEETNKSDENKNEESKENNNSEEEEENIKKKIIKDFLTEANELSKREKKKDFKVSAIENNKRGEITPKDKKDFSGFGDKEIDTEDLGREINNYLKLETKHFKYNYNITLTYEDFLHYSKTLFLKIKKSVSILKDMETERYLSGFESGKIDSRKIHKLFTGYSRVFKRKTDLELGDKDLAIAILVDESGSMIGSGKDVMSVISCGALSLALEKAGKNFGIFGFNSTFSYHKRFGKKLYMPDIYNILKNSRGYYSGRTNDAYALKKVVKEMSKLPEKNKIIIVLSDGSPNPSRDMSDENIAYNDYSLKDEVKNAEKFCKVYSIGILDSNVLNYYNHKTTMVLEDLENLPSSLFKIFKDNVGLRKR